LLWEGGKLPDRMSFFCAAAAVWGTGLFPPMIYGPLSGEGRWAYIIWIEECVWVLWAEGCPGNKGLYPRRQAVWSSLSRMLGLFHICVEYWEFCLLCGCNKIPIFLPFKGWEANFL
jgi:hypothetical protein